MLQLANSEVAALYTIPVSDWTAINKRVGAVMALLPVEEDVKVYLPAYTGLKKSCLYWELSGFARIITLSQDLCKYSLAAISGFTELKVTVDRLDRNAPIPDTVQNMIREKLHWLQQETIGVSIGFSVESNSIYAFLNQNNAIDMEMEANKSKLDVFWKPLGEQISSVETGLGKVVSTWNAVSDDLIHALDDSVSMTSAFIASLNIDAALKHWAGILLATGGYAKAMDGQAKYWLNPFEHQL